MLDEVNETFVCSLQSMLKRRVLWGQELIAALHNTVQRFTCPYCQAQLMQDLNNLRVKSLQAE